MTVGAIAVTTLTFLAVFLAIVAINLVITDLHERDRRKVLDRMEEELRVRQRERARQSASSQQDLGNLSKEALENNQKPSLRQWISDLTEQSGLQITLGRLIIFCSVAAVIVGGLGGLLSGSLIVAAVGAMIAACLPITYVRMARQKRHEALRSQLPDSFDLMSRIMRSGQTITQAMQSVATEFKAPISSEFGYCYEQQNLGLDPELALRDLARRTGLLEIKIFVVSLLVQRQAGGNLAELLDRLATIVRHRFKIRGEVKSITAEGRLQAIILLALPPVMFCLLLVVNRPYMMKLFDHSSLLIATLVLMTAGALWIRKIVNFDF